MAVGDYLGDKEYTIGETINPNKQDVTKILLEDQNRTVVFTKLNGGKAVGNLFSTREKIAKALGIKPEEIIDILSKAVDNPTGAIIKENPRFREKLCQLDLTALPIPKYYPRDGGNYITSGIVVAGFGGNNNVSFHRMMIMDWNHLAIRLVPRHLYKLHQAAKAKGEELPISICIGAPPQVMLSAATPVPFGVDELSVACAFTNYVTGKPLEVGRCDNGLIVPSDCDYVIEGKITLEETDEGPFVDITGTYDYVRKQPIVKVEKIWSVKDPYFQLLLPGGNEHFLFMGVPREPMILKACRKAGVDVKNVRLSEGGCCWLNGIVSIRKKDENDGRKAIEAAFEGHPSMKNVIIVDDDIDIYDDREVEWAVATRFQADRLVVIPNSKGSSLDPSATDSVTNKVGTDATIPLGRDKADFVKATLD